MDDDKLLFNNIELKFNKIEKSHKTSRIEFCVYVVCEFLCMLEYHNNYICHIYVMMTMDKLNNFLEIISSSYPTFIELIPLVRCGVPCSTNERLHSQTAYEYETMRQLALLKYLFMSGDSSLGFLERFLY